MTLEAFGARRRLPSKYERYSILLDQGVAAWNAWREQNPDEKIDLSGIQLCYIDLPGVNFSDMVLDNCRLRGDNLRGANFSRTSMRYATIERCQLDDGIFTGVNSSYAVIRGTTTRDVIGREGLLGALSSERRSIF